MMLPLVFIVILAAISLPGSKADNNYEINTSGDGTSPLFTTKRADGLFGLTIPDSIARIPILGNIIARSAELLTNTTNNVFAPALYLLNTLTSGHYSPGSPLYQLTDNVSGGVPSALSGGAGLRPPVFDVNDLVPVVMEHLDSIAQVVDAVANPLFTSLNIPGSVIGTVLRKLIEVTQGFPKLELVPNPTTQ